MLSEADVIWVLLLLLLADFTSREMVVRGLVYVVWGRFLSQVILGVSFMKSIQEVLFTSFEV